MSSAQDGCRRHSKQWEATPRRVFGRPWLHRPTENVFWKTFLCRLYRSRTESLWRALTEAHHWCGQSNSDQMPLLDGLISNLCNRNNRNSRNRLQSLWLGPSGRGVRQPARMPTTRSAPSSLNAKYHPTRVHKLTSSRNIERPPAAYGTQ